MQFDVKKLIPYITSIIAIVIVNIMFFMPQFEGKVIRQNDIVQHVAMSKEISDFNAKSGEKALWTDAMFGGMPSYQVSLPNDSNYLSFAERILFLGFDRPAGYFIAGMLGMFLLFNLLGVSPWLSLIGALLFGFTTNNLVLFEAGHNSKLMTIMTSPLVIAGVILAYRQQLLAGAAVFGIGLGINILNNHPQMTYYLGMVLALLVIVELVKSIRESRLMDFAKASGVLAIVTVLGIGASAGRLWPTYEYTKSTMRGGQVLESTTAKTTNTDVKGGLEWDYAMAWSNGVGDLIATFVPKAVGGGSGEWIAGDTELAKAVGQRGGLQAPTYWGSLPFTSGPAYYGIVAFFLFVFGLFVVKNEIKWWLHAAVLLTTLMSMGKHMEGLNRLLYDILPMLNKFRAPSSILSITAILIPILGVLALSEISKSDDKLKFIRPLFISTGIVGGICSVLALVGGSLFDFVGAGDDQYAQIKDLLVDQRIDMLRSSSFRSLGFVLVSAALLYFYCKNVLNLTVMATGIGLLTLMDVFPMGKEYLDKRDFVNKNSIKSEYNMRPVDEQILADKGHYRVFDVTVDPFNNAMGAYYHNLVGGYHPAKLQRYQDIIERHLTKNNMGVLNMLNTKYVINAGPDKNPIVQQNPGAFGNAWFADSIIHVGTNNQEIDALDSFRTKSAIVHKEFDGYMANLKAVKGDGQINLESYTPNKVIYKSKSGQEQLAVFSEIWYGPNLGWQAYIDGKAVDHIRANYILRALKVPAGDHEVVFEFKPKSYFMGNTIGMICSSLILLLLVFWGWRSYADKGKVEAAK